MSTILIIILLIIIFGGVDTMPMAAMGLQGSAACWG